MPVDRTRPFSPARWLLVAGLALLGLRAASAQETLLSARDLAGGRLELHKIPGAKTRSVVIWLPPGYEESDQRYPVAYLLHGKTRNYSDFSNIAPGSVARLVEEGRIEPMILVIPSWPDTTISAASAPAFWDFVATDLVPWTDRNYRTLPERGWRAVGGHSLGGVGALAISLLRPDVFRYVGSLDGAAGMDGAALLELLKLHKQYLFPLSLWMQRGRESISAGFSPRPLLDFLDTLHMPYVYLETEDNHFASRDNNIDDLLVFFFDQMRTSAADVPPPPGRATEHFVVVAGSGSSIDIEVDLGAALADAGGDIRVDLSELGMEPVLLDHDGSGRYTGSVRLPADLRNSFYILPVTRMGGAHGPEHVYGIRVSVLPSEDLVLFSEALSPGWELVTSRLTAVQDVLDGWAVLALTSTGSWRLDWSAMNPLPLFGYEVLSFEFHAGTASVAEGRTPRLRLTMGGKTIDLLTEVDLTSSEWQRLTIPLERFGARVERLDLVLAGGLGFTGNLEGTFYLRDVHLIRRVPPVSTAVAEEQGDRRPRDFRLQQNYPNPFNSETVIRFALPESGEMELAVFNLAGQQVVKLVEGVREAGNYTVHWDGRDRQEHGLASGVYVYRLRVGEQMGTRKLLLLR